MWEPRKTRLAEKQILGKEKQLFIFEVQGSKQNKKSADCQVSLRGTRSKASWLLGSAMEVSLHLGEGEPQSCDLPDAERPTAPIIVSVVCLEPQPALCSLCAGSSLQTRRGLVFKPLSQAKFWPFCSKGEGLQRRQAGFSFVLLGWFVCWIVGLDFF